LSELELHKIDRELEEGWCGGQRVRYLAAGTTSLSPADMYIMIQGFTKEGQPDVLPTHRQVLNNIPGMPSYSALRLVHFVEIDPARPPGSIKSVPEVMAAAKAIHTPGIILNTPVVPRDTNTVLPVIPAWHSGNEVAYLDGGPVPLRTNNVFLCVFGVDRASHKIVYVPQQKMIFQYPPRHPMYSPVCRLHYVKVEASYEANSIRSVEEIHRRRLPVKPTTQFVNASILDVKAG
jgi:hypothetical protein